jgi:hypothetical protein
VSTLCASFAQANVIYKFCTAKKATLDLLQPPTVALEVADYYQVSQVLRVMLREDGGPGLGGETTTQFDPSEAIFSSPAVLLTLSTTSFHPDGNIVVKALSLDRVKIPLVSTVIDPAGSSVSWCWQR